MPITIKLEKFEGPLALLLELIEAKKLEISEISLADVTDQYLAYIKKAELIPSENLADFLVVASRLLLIKSRSLLPSFLLSKEEEAEVRELEHALKEYQRYKEASKTIKSLVLSERIIVSRSLWQGREGSFSPPKNISSLLLEKALTGVVLNLQRFLQPFDKAVMKRVETIESKIKEILGRVEGKAASTLKDLARPEEKLDLILAFLAVLFLFKEKVVHISQDNPFGEILIETRKKND